MTNPEPQLTIREAAQRTGLSVHTLRYYERIGLLLPVERAANGHRRYAEIDLRRIEFLNKLRTTGMSIQQMCEFAALSQESDLTVPQRLAMLEAHRNEVLTYLDELRDNLGAIERKIALYRSIEEKQG
ncbi:MAG: MerR family transcriptional regulator [Anaerolineae bacterium]|nr:MerR family transcriptional regulator [Anaerolineae bacterium]